MEVSHKLYLETDQHLVQNAVNRIAGAPVMKPTSF